MTPAPLRPPSAEAEAALRALPGIAQVQVVMTAHGPAPEGPAAQPEDRPASHAACRRAAAHVGRGPYHRDRFSGKGGVGKSTVSSNLAVALARQGRRVGLLDADIHGPSQPRMMGVTGRPHQPRRPDRSSRSSAHGVTMMSLGLMLKEDEAVIWRGPMLMGALQQLLTQVDWGTLDVLIIDLPPGTGDVQLTLCQRTQLTGAIVVSTPQDVALLDARKAHRHVRTS